MTPRGRRFGFRALVWSTLVVLVTSCSVRAGVTGAGALPPPDGEQLAQTLFDELRTARRSTPLPPLARDAALDEQARKGTQVIDRGVPDPAKVRDQIEAAAPLPDELRYGIAFEARTRGLDERLRDAGQHALGPRISTPLLAADPALDGMGWAATGPWVVAVFRARRLAPADAPALQAALEAGVQGARPALHADPKLAAIAADVLADDVLDYDDEARLGRAGGVPVHIWNRRTDLHLPTLALNAALVQEDLDGLREAWLGQVGVAAKVTESGTVLFVVLATGEADRRALSSQLTAAREPRASELVNRARAEAALPPVRADPALADAAGRWLAESTARGCFAGLDPGCPGADPPGGARRWWILHGTWSSHENAFTWYVAPAEPGDEQLKRFGTAAAIGPDGLVWMVLLLAL